MSSVKVLTSLILNQNFCSPKNIRMFLRTVREPSEFGRALFYTIEFRGWDQKVGVHVHLLHLLVRRLCIYIYIYIKELLRWLASKPVKCLQMSLNVSKCLQNVSKCLHWDISPYRLRQSLIPNVPLLTYTKYLPFVENVLCIDASTYPKLSVLQLLLAP